MAHTAVTARRVAAVPVSCWRGSAQLRTAKQRATPKLKLVVLSLCSQVVNPLLI